MKDIKEIINTNPENTILVFDIDGTLIGNKKVIENGKETNIKYFPEDAIEAIKTFQELGYKCGINTGRSLESSVQTTVLDKGIAWDFAICSNGQTIIDGNGNIIQKDLVERDAVNEIVRRAQENHIGIIMDTEEGFVNIGKLTEQQKADLGKTQYKEKKLEDVEECRCFSLVNGGGYDEKEMSEIFKDIPGVKINFSSREYFDIVRDDDSKALAARKFAKHVGADNIIAFGDEKNDIEMAKDCDYFVCMGNGNKEVKELANYITTDWNEKGIWNAAMHLAEQIDKIPEIQTETLHVVRTNFEEKIINNEKEAKQYLNGIKEQNFAQLNVIINTTKNGENFHTEIPINSLQASKDFLGRGIDYQYMNMVVQPNNDIDRNKTEKIDKTSELFMDKKNNNEYIANKEKEETIKDWEENFQKMHGSMSFIEETQSHETMFINR